MVSPFTARLQHAQQTRDHEAGFSNRALFSTQDRRVAVAGAGPGSLAGLGTGRPRTEEPFGATTCTTYDGRALAIIRPKEPGQIGVTISADGCDALSIKVHAEQTEQTDVR